MLKEDLIELINSLPPTADIHTTYSVPSPHSIEKYPNTNIMHSSTEEHEIDIRIKYKSTERYYE